MKELVIKTPAKINFGLNIISKREDGYHNIETIFYPINIFDTLTIREDDKFSFTTSDSKLNLEQNNTIIKAKELLSQATGNEIKVSITLDKRIPIGAGMGGGSSDGAATLLALNKFYDFRLTDVELFSMALRIGSDVPFFIDPEPKFASARGEVFEATSLDIDKPILIINPGIHISTLWAFSKVEPIIPKYKLNQIKPGDNNNLFQLRDKVTNDFETIVFSTYPEIMKIKNTMYEHGAEFALMTGSGSTVFGIFPDISFAEDTISKLPRDYFTFIDRAGRNG
jgi:4-diphosphocytidyl-2-C-methyl-D-erythritol kinase